MPGKAWKGAGTYLSDHAATGLVALTVRGPLLLLLQYSLPTSPILKGKLSQRVTELHDADVPRCLRSVAQVEQEGVEPRQVGRSGGLDSLLVCKGRWWQSLLTLAPSPTCCRLDGALLSAWRPGGYTGPGSG